MSGTTDTPTEPGAHVASQAGAISNAVVGLLFEYTGRGPTKARTTIGPDAIVVTLGNCLTKAERRLCRNGHAADVLAMRRHYQNSMRDDLVAAVEGITGATVEAFLSDNLHDPDLAVEIFIMRLDENSHGDRIDHHRSGAPVTPAP